jgi:hypothetical protein
VNGIIAPRAVITAVASLIINKVMPIDLVLSFIAKVRVCCNTHKKDRNRPAIRDLFAVRFH